MQDGEQSYGIVAVVDDEEHMRETVEILLRSVSLKARSFSSGTAFLSEFTVEGPGCIIVDVRMPEMSGLELLRLIREKNIDLPVIMMTGHADVELAINAFREGAFDFIEKPFSASAMIDLVQRALKASRNRFEIESEKSYIRSKVDDLSDREKEVLSMIVTGSSSKEIGRELGISPRTAEHHRMSVIQKMGAGSAIELASMMTKLKLD